MGVDYNLKRSAMKKSQFNEHVPKLIQSQSTLDLVDILSPLVNFEKVTAHHRFFFCADGVNMCYVIRSGLVRVVQGSDEDEIVIGSVPVPNIFGISDLLSSTTRLFLETMGDSEVATLTTIRVNQLIAETDAWKLLVGHITKQSANLFNYNMMMTAPTTYDIVRFQLLALMQEKTDIRESTSAVKYILERTRLSRSTVMKMLAQLRQGDYIELSEGVLKEIYHLPARY